MQEIFDFFWWNSTLKLVGFQYSRDWPQQHLTLQTVNYFAQDYLLNTSVSGWPFIAAFLGLRMLLQTSVIMSKSGISRRNSVNMLASRLVLKFNCVVPCNWMQLNFGSFSVAQCGFYAANSSRCWSWFQQRCQTGVYSRCSSRGCGVNDPGTYS